MKNNFLKTKKGDNKRLEEKMGAKKLLEMRLFKLQQEDEANLLQSCGPLHRKQQENLYETKFDPATIPANRTILNDFMKTHQVENQSSESDVSHEEILDDLLYDFNHKKLLKFTSDEQIKLTRAIKQIKIMKNEDSKVQSMNVAPRVQSVHTVAGLT